MNSTEIRSILRSPYNRENWKNLYRNIFQNKVTFHEEPYQYNVNEDIVESLFQIGYATLDDEYIVALFEVNIKSDVNLLSKKIGLRKIISKYISDDKFNGVLTIFENGSTDYRFTFASKTTKITEDGIEIIETESKRFTYILGENEPCLTPTQRFENLLKKNGKVNLDDIKDAFSVEKLNKEFFNGYKEHYESLCNYFYSIPNKIIFFKNDDKLIRDFVKKFLGRIVFLYFVQKKGWLGVKKGHNWGTGDHLFLSNLFKSYKNKNQFYNKVISKIFFEYLSVDRKDDIVNIFEDKVFRIPYLNGGLFEKEEVDEFEINLEQSFLESLFSFFDRFNFTIYEDDPNEHTVAVDPEMLGHIFENLLEDNKDKGAFYTPKEIVHYMCQESLIEYLTTWFEDNGYEIVSYSSFNKPEQPGLFSENEGRKGQLVFENKSSNKSKIIDRVLIEKLLKKRLTDDDKNLILSHADEFHIALNKVKICDPAIGSGAFPMGLLQEIFISKQTLWNFEHGTLNDFPASDVKLNIIQNSIYGVDIEKGAVDVARLRFWLSLIVDEEEPKSLPNLDYKIVVGNSLVSTFEGEVVEIDWNIKFNNVDSVKKMILDQQNKLYQLEHSQHLYFQSFTNKDSLSKNINKLKLDILINQFNLSKFYFNENNPILGGFIPSDSENKKNDFNKSYINKINSTLEKLESIKRNDNFKLNYFDWRLNFPEIFNDKITDKVGFDILIGNPPYLGEKSNKELFQKINDSHLGIFYKRRMDLFYFFFHLSLNLGKEKSIISFITTNYFLNADGAINIRKDFKSRSNILKLINFNNIQVFESAKGQHNIITLLQKKSKGGRDKMAECIDIIDKTNIGKTDLHNLIDKSNFKIICQEDLYSEENCYINVFSGMSSNNNLDYILDKMKHENSSLSKYFKVESGIQTSLDKISLKHIEKYKNLDLIKGQGVFVLSESEYKSISNISNQNYFKPWYKNSDIKKFTSIINNKKKEYLIYIKDEGVPIKLDKNLSSHFSKYKDILTDIKQNCFSNKWLRKIVEPWLQNGNYFVLFYPRYNELFIGDKIIAPYRSKDNIFSYVTEDWYSSVDVTFLTKRNDELSYKYVLGLLNSKLIYFWLYNRGKRKGEMLELYPRPVSEIPIPVIRKDKQIQFENIIDDIIYNVKENKSIEKLVINLDIMVFKLFNISYEDASLIASLEKTHFDSISIL